MVKYIWFSIGQKGMHGVTWQCAIIRDDFNPDTILFEDCDWDENDEPLEKWVAKDELSYSLHESVAMSFEDLNKVATWIKNGAQPTDTVKALIEKASK